MGAKVIPRESKRITYSSEIRALKLVAFTAEQLSIVNGSLLGDGCLYEAWPGSSKNYTFAKMHSIKQEAYIEWVHDKLKPFTRTPIKPYAPTQSLRLRTISHATFTELRSVFYHDGKKVLPETIAEIIKDPLAVAVWFMDDGNVVQDKNGTHGYHINTQSFDEKEQRKIAHLFAEIWGIDCTLQRNKGKFRIFVRKHSMEHFLMLIQLHIIPSMQYKLGHIGDSLRTRRD